MLYYGGSIGGERAEYLIQFLKSYSELRDSAKELWKKIRIVINGVNSPDFEEALKRLDDSTIIFEKSPLPINEYIEKLKASDFGILPIHNDYADSCFSTKVFDYFYLKKPIVHLGRRGKVSEFIEENGIGFTFDPNEEAKVFFEKLLKGPSMVKYTKELYDKIKQEYDIENLSLKYFDLIS